MLPESQEIERKFLVKGNGWMDNVKKIVVVRQAYLSLHNPEIRVRLNNDQAVVTVKGAREGMTRFENEMPVPADMAERLIERSALSVEKIRHIVEHDGNKWEVDVFGGKNNGLVLAEIELKSESQNVKLPKWVDKEVTHIPEYYNASLAIMPVDSWR